MKKLSILWRLYLGILILIHIMVLADDTLPQLKSDSVVTIAIILFSMVDIVGVVLYILKIPTLNRSLWTGILLLTIVWDLYQNLYIETYVKHIPMTWEYVPAYIFLILPLYVAIFKYRSTVPTA